MSTNNNPIQTFDFSAGTNNAAGMTNTFNTNNFTPITIDASPYNNTNANAANPTSVLNVNMDAVNADAQAQPQQAPPDNSSYKGIHPVAAVFHVAFKILALLLYLLGTFFFSYVLTFILTILCCAADFWTTKNITGRLLVSLRWWNQINEDGSSQWVFESSPEADQRVNNYDSKFFWVTLIGYAVVWVLLTLFSITSPSNLPITIIGAVLAWSNVWGYIKCRRDAQQRLTSFVTSQAAQNPSVVSKAASVFGWGASAAASAVGGK